MQVSLKGIMGEVNSSTRNAKMNAGQSVHVRAKTTFEFDIANEKRNKEIKISKNTQHMPQNEY